MYEEKQERPICPFCGSEHIARIQWGRPIWNSELERKLRKKEVVLGGCMISADCKKWECNDCGKRFGEANLLF